MSESERHYMEGNINWRRCGAVRATAAGGAVPVLDIGFVADKKTLLIRSPHGVCELSEDAFAWLRMMIAESAARLALRDAEATLAALSVSADKDGVRQ